MSLFYGGVNFLKLKLSQLLIFYTLYTKQMTGDKTLGIEYIYPCHTLALKPCMPPTNVTLRIKSELLSVTFKALLSLSQIRLYTCLLQCVSF